MVKSSKLKGQKILKIKKGKRGNGKKVKREKTVNA